MDSIKSIFPIADFLGKHVYYDIVTVNRELTEDLWKSHTKNAQLIIASSVFYLNALSRQHTKPTDAFLLFFDDCAYGSGEHSMKQVFI